MAPFHISPFAIPPLMTLLLFPPGYYYYTSSPSDPCALPSSFPPHIPRNLTAHQNWAGEIAQKCWTAYPENPHQLLELVNWARYHGFKVRPRGSSQSWGHFIHKFDYPSDQILIVDTTKHLTKMQVISSQPGSSYFWAEIGIQLYNLLSILEENDLGIGSFPNARDSTLGEILALGGHGVGSYGANETSPPELLLGSMSNLIISLTAAVYDPILDSYVLQEFHRTHPDTKAFLVHLGRAFITNVTMQAGPLVNYLLNSRVELSPEILFAPPANPSPVNSFASQLEKVHRVAVSYNALTNKILLKTWKTSPEKPFGVEGLNSDSISEDFSQNRQFWGPSKNMLTVSPHDSNYSKSSSAAGWAVITNHENIQRVVHEFYLLFKEHLEKQRPGNATTLNVGIEIGTAELDHAGDVGIPGAESPGLGTLQPIQDRPDLNVAVYLNVISREVAPSIEGRAVLKFMAEVEQSILERFDTDWSLVRVDWSKSWALSQDPFYDEILVRDLRIIGRFSPAWEYSISALNRYDPFGIFTNRLLDDLLHSHDHLDTPYF